MKDEEKTYKKSSGRNIEKQNVSRVDIFNNKLSDFYFTNIIDHL